MRILVVEDDPSVRALLVADLELAGHEVEAVEHGTAGLASVAASTPDAVVCDVMMPEVSGWDVVRTLRADERWKRLPVVLLTARDTTDDVRHGYEAGASLVLSKPYDAGKLDEVLTALVSMQR
ncbi:MAG: response regulator [Frankiales bacterium]|jgi:two-component system alkaline phosphatase synthesis response regulator PhoP|nr:response regulator [Frankiales bacterium]